MSNSRLLISLLLAAGLGSASLALAQGTTATGAPTAATVKPATASQPESKLVNEFSVFAGSRDNATALVQGLRSGSTINLQAAPTTPGGTPTTTSFTPPTRPMGYGNVRIAMALARTQLASQGVSNPTPQQLQGALMGTPASGTQAGSQGILQMRASGMGWGKIANTMGYKLGAVMSGKQPPATTGAAGISTAAGRAGSPAAGKGVVNASGGSAAGGGEPKGKGIVSAGGGAVNSNAGGVAAGKSAGGIVSAHGAGNAGGAGASRKSGKN